MTTHKLKKGKEKRSHYSNRPKKLICPYCASENIVSNMKNGYDCIDCQFTCENSR